MNRPTPPARGFTLIEIAIALAVMAILGAIALPNFGAALERHRLQATAQALAADISEARFEAARRGHALHLQSSTGPAWCWSVSEKPGCSCGQADACQLRNVRATDHPGVRLISAHSLQLEDVGANQAGPAAVLESTSGNRLRVDVTALGRTRICAAAGNWPKLPKC